MKSVPWWKIKRELLRIPKMLASLPKRIFLYYFSTPYYDRFLSKQKIILDGALPIRDRIAIFVIFPIDGLQPSVLLTLEHIAASGYSPIVISNHPLRETEQTAVIEKCAEYIERPNYGYDFGAYRDGILHTIDHFARLKRLVLLNDSTWYPVHDKSNWILDAERMGHDLVGATSNFGIRIINPDTYLNLKWTWSSSHRNFHYNSYALSLGPKLFRSNGFRRFWKNLALYNEFKMVVRQGEIKFSQWVLRSGFSHDCTWNLRDLDKQLYALRDNRLEEISQNLIIVGDRSGLKQKIQTLKTSRTDPNWRNKMHQLILMSASVQGIGMALSDLMINEMAFPFLKKKPMRKNADGSDATLRIIKKLPNKSMGKIILNESELIRKKFESRWQDCQSR